MRRDDKKALKRQRLLESAVTVFARDGFHQARISDIATEAGVGHGTFYLYFDGKEEVLLAIHDELMKQALDEVRHATSTGTNAVEKLELLTRALYKMVEENRALTQLLLVESRYMRQFMRSGAMNRIQDFVDFVEEILREGVEDGTFRPDMHAKSVATFLFSGMDGVITRWLLGDTMEPLQEQLEGATRVILRGILNESD